MNTPVTDLLPLHQDLIKSWVTKQPLPSVEKKGSPRRALDEQNLDRAIAHYLQDHEAAAGKLISLFGDRGRAEAVIDSIERLKQKGAIEYGHNFKWRAVVNDRAIA